MAADSTPPTSKSICFGVCEKFQPQIWGSGERGFFSRLLSLIRSNLRSCGPIGPFPVVESFPVADRLKKVRRFFRWNIKNEVLVENRAQPISGEEIDTCGIEPLGAKFFPLNFPPRTEPLFFTDFFRDLNFERGFLCSSAFSFGFKTYFFSILQIGKNYISGKECLIFSRFVWI